MKTLNRSVWYCSSAPIFKLPFIYDDTGILAHTDSEIWFLGKKVEVQIKYSKSECEVGMYGADFFNKWIRVKNIDGAYVYLTDGSFMGWGGKFGGVKRLFEVLLHHHHNEPHHMQKNE